MPLPSPNANEETNDFISRCRNSDTMKAEFPRTVQRLAVCYAQARKAGRKVAKPKGK